MNFLKSPNEGHVFFSFFSRFPRPKPLEDETAGPYYDPFEPLARGDEGVVLKNFALFHHDTTTIIDLLIFFPYRGLFLGERIGWSAKELQGTTVERASRQAKKTPATRLDAMESKVRRKLEDVLSFDSTPVERFFWMENLNEEEFDHLHASFQELLPKSRLLFRDEPVESIREKLFSLLGSSDLPYSETKVIGSLISHELLLPDAANPFGRLLNDEQKIFLHLEPAEKTVLTAPYGGGKSTLLIRKAVALLLSHPDQELLFITPTLLSGELLRDQIVSLMEYGAFYLNLSSFHFYTPEMLDPEQISLIAKSKILKNVTYIFGDDVHLMDESFITALDTLIPAKSLCLTTVISAGEASSSVSLPYSQAVKTESLGYNGEIENLIEVMLSKLRIALRYHKEDEMMILAPEETDLASIQMALNEHLDLQSMIITPSFSLQHNHLNRLILAHPDAVIGISRPIVYLIDGNLLEPHGYSFALSRASESLTIITSENPACKEASDENYKN